MHGTLGCTGRCPRDILYGFNALNAGQRFCDEGADFYPFISVRPVVRGNIHVRP